MRRLSIPLLIIGMLTSVLVACGGADQGNRPSTSEPSATTLTTSTTTAAPETTTAAPETTTTTSALTTTTVPEIGPEWTRVRLIKDRRVVDVVATEDGFVASGGKSIWFSEDALEWERVSHHSGESTALYALTAGETGLVALGNCGGFMCERAGMWTSPDGRTWQVAEKASMDAGPEFAYFNDVIAVESTFLAAGQADSAAAAVWSNEGEQHWSLEWEHGTVNSAAYALDAVGDGYAAVGFTSREVDELSLQVAAVWMSPDGSSWTLVSNDLDVFGPTSTADLDAVSNWSARAIASGDFGIVVGGGSSGITSAHVPQAAVWHSADGGRTWVRPEQQSGVFDRAEISDITVTPEGLIAVGHSNGSAAMWSSVDGLTWEQVALDSTVFPLRSRLFELIVHNDVMIAVGEFGHAAIWVKRSSDS